MQGASFLHGLLDPLSSEDVFSLPEQLVMTGGESLSSYMSWRERRPTVRRARGGFPSLAASVGRGPGDLRGGFPQQYAARWMGAGPECRVVGPPRGRPALQDKPLPCTHHIMACVN